MAGKVSVKRVSVPTDAVRVAQEKRALRMRRAVVPISGTVSEIVAKRPTRFAKGLGPMQLQIRRMGRGGPLLTSSRARSLAACKGKKGCEFVECVKTALGKIPEGLKVACPSA